MKVRSFIMAVLILLFSSVSLASNSTPKVVFNQKGWDKHKSAIINAARETNTNPVSLAAYASIETTMGANMTNKRNRSVAGLFQFTDRTWRDQLKRNGRKYGLSMNTSKYNTRANALMAAELARENREYLEKKLGRTVTMSEVYMAHMLGVYGAERILKAKNTSIAANVTAPSGNKSFFYSKGRPVTVGQFKANIRNYVEGHASVYRGSAIRYMAKTMIVSPKVTV
ncbi:hypothetical protein DQR70_05950 [Salmonella enterica subsp. enterica serovar Oslo]|nr:hypothetical protein [Salmonella enterica subsp. enterica serovar Oslo]